jgi:hypothetical protein
VLLQEYYNDPGVVAAANLEAERAKLINELVPRVLASVKTGAVNVIIHHLHKSKLITNLLCVFSLEFDR